MPRAAVTLPVPPEVAFAAWTDPEGAPRWMASVVSVRPAGERGAVWEGLLGGKRKAWFGATTELRPGRSVAWDPQGDVGLACRAVFEPLGAGATRLSVEMSWRAPVGAPWAEPLRRFGDLDLAAELARFQAYVASRCVPAARAAAVAAPRA